MRVRVRPAVPSGIGRVTPAGDPAATHSLYTRSHI